MTFNLKLIEKELIPLWGIIILLLLVGCGTEAKEQKPRVIPRHPEDRITISGSREIPYKLNKNYEYLFQTQNGEVGKGSFVIEQTENDGFKISSWIDINDETAGSITKGKSVFLLDEKWRPQSYKRETYGEYKDNPDSNGTEIIDISFSNNSANIKISGPQKDRKSENDVELPEGGFVFDNNFTGLMAFICSQPELRSGRVEVLKVLSINLQRLLTVKMIPKIKVELKFKEAKMIAYEVDMKANESTFGRYFITADGVLLKAEEMGGLMLIELLNPDI